MNDQEDEDLQSEFQDDSASGKSFNEQLPSHLASSSESDQRATQGITTHNQPEEILMTNFDNLLGP